MNNAISTPKTSVLFALRVGKQQGQTAEMLAANAGLDTTVIASIINQLQKDGQLIVEDAGRYFVAETLEEWVAYRDRAFMEAAVDLAQRHRAMTRAAAHRWPRQWRTFPVAFRGQAA